jgi:hypothetical protein
MTGCAFLSHPQEQGSGDYLHRVRLPAQALSRHWPVEELQTSQPDFVRRAVGCDLLVVNMVADLVIERIFDARRRLGRPSVFEINDDFQHFPRTLPGRDFYALPRTQRLIAGLAASADLLQFSSHGLRQAYGHLNPRQVVFVNHLGELPALPAVAPREGTDVVLGWAGSAGHADDAIELASLLTHWAQRRRARGWALPRLRLMAAPQVVSAFEGCGLDVEARAAADFAQYLQFLCSLDVGFACIASEPFALGRSDGKFIELASRGVVCIASDRGEYCHGMLHGETGFLYADQAQFDLALDLVVDDAGTRQKVRATAHEHLALHRLHAGAVRHRAAVYAPLMGLHEAPPPGDHRLLLARQEQGPECALERRMLAAALRHREGRHDMALDLYVECMQEAPDFYLPWERAAAIAGVIGSQKEAAFLARLAERKLLAALEAGACRHFPYRPDGGAPTQVVEWGR